MRETAASASTARAAFANASRSGAKIASCRDDNEDFPEDQNNKEEQLANALIRTKFF